MERIHIYADFDFFERPESVGTLSYESVRGKDHFAFEYSHEWLAKHGDILLSGDVMNVGGIQHPRQGTDVFGFVKDSFPDRWGRVLLDRRERLTAKEEGRTARTLTSYDYLVGIEDRTRMGGLRYKNDRSDDYINTGSKYNVPPIESLHELCDACQAVEQAEEHHELPERRWLNQLINPGSSLGGARPKSNVADADGTLYVAKFPSKKDLENAELLEHFGHLLANRAGITTAKTKLIKISKGRDLLLSERFDRTRDGKRIHFASAMALLGLDDGCGADTGNGYLDIVDFIVSSCTDVKNNLKELYRRVAFNILFGNTDDHFRNHGFVLTPKGWTLSPAYDINPSSSRHQCLLINEQTEQADLAILQQSCESYMLDAQESKDIIKEVIDAVKDWEMVAQKHQIPPRALDKYAARWNEDTHIYIV